MRLDESGANRTVLAATAGFTPFFAVDATRLHWSDVVGGSRMKVALK